MISKEVEDLPPVDRFGFFPEVELVFGQKIIASHEVLPAFDFLNQSPLRYEHTLEYVDGVRAHVNLRSGC